MRIAFVVQRYGREVNGGAELHCRMLAERLARRAEVEQVTVLTTCAKQYSTWANDYPAGAETLAGVQVERFPVLVERLRPLQSLLAGWIMRLPHPRSLEWLWLLAQGPLAPGLLKRIGEVRDDYDAFIFFTYLYLPTVLGLRRLRARRILIPTAHDERPIRLGIFRQVFERADAIAYNTEAERQFAEQQLGLAGKRAEVVGCGVELPEAVAEPAAGQARARPPPYLLYLGRLDTEKGVDELGHAFLEFKRSRGDRAFRSGGHPYHGRDLQLVLAGGGALPSLPEHPDIVREGFVSEQRKLALLRDCEALAMPSRYESLSLVMLEAWTLKKPVLVEQRCAVTSDHVRRSKGGLCYHGRAEFARQLARLLDDPALRQRQGEAGQRYVQAHYGWDGIERRLLELAREVATMVVAR